MLLCYIHNNSCLWIYRLLDSQSFSHQHVEMELPGGGCSPYWIQLMVGAYVIVDDRMIRYNTRLNSRINGTEVIAVYCMHSSHLIFQMNNSFETPTEFLHVLN